MTSPENIAQYNEYLLNINPLNEFRKLIGAPIVEPLLPNFCRGGNTQDRSNFDKDMDKKKDKKPDVKPIGYDNSYIIDLGNENEQDRINRLNDGYLPGTNPNNPLNQSIPPPDGGNDYYSNTGAEGRYKDTKAIYEHDYLTSINLGIGILLTIYIISKKA